MKIRHLLPGLLLLAACKGADTKSETPQADSGTATAADGTPLAAPTPVEPSPALLNPDTVALKKASPPKYNIVFVTSEGEVEVSVTRSLAPLGADRLYYLASNGFFSGAKFFRVVRGFVAQFGLSGIPAVDAAFDQYPLRDDPPKMSNKKGTLVFATAGPNTRTTQMFINLADNGMMLDSQGFAPLGEVVRGMDIVEKFFSDYGEMVGQQQSLIMSRGNPWMMSRYPDLDSIVTATVKP